MGSRDSFPIDERRDTGSHMEKQCSDALNRAFHHSYLDVTSRIPALGEEEEAGGVGSRLAMST